MAAIHTFWSRCFQSAERTIRRTGLRRSKFGRGIVSALNSAGQLGLSVYFRVKRQPVIVQRQQMLAGTWKDGSFRSTLELLLDRYEPETTKLFHRLIRPGMTVVDIGAHGGYFSLIAASLVGTTGKVYAFEPHPRTFKLLERNIELNRYKNIYPVHKAVADHSGTMKLLLHPKGSDRHSLYIGERGHEISSIDVETTTLDDFLDSQDWPHVDLVKMDIEGAEPSALAGMRNALERCGIRFLVTEFSPPALEAAGFDPRDFLGTISEKGFSVFQLESDESSKPLTLDEFSVLIHALEDRGGTNLFCETGQMSASKAPLW